MFRRCAYNGSLALNNTITKTMVFQRVCLKNENPTEHVASLMRLLLLLLLLFFCREYSRCTPTEYFYDMILGIQFDAAVQMSHLQIVIIACTKSFSFSHRRINMSDSEYFCDRLIEFAFCK